MSERTLLIITALVVAGLVVLTSIVAAAVISGRRKRSVTQLIQMHLLGCIIPGLTFTALHIVFVFKTLVGAYSIELIWIIELPQQIV